MRIATYNVNGIRAARRRGFEQWLATCNPDVVALQEVRAQHADIPEGVYSHFHVTYEEGNLKGRNGVALLTREQPAAIRTWSGQARLNHEIVATQDVALARGLKEFSLEGRYVEVDLADEPLTVASLYLPKGGLPAHLQKPGRMRDAPDGGVRYQRKMRFLDAFGRQLGRARRDALRQGREFLLMGDLNIGHTKWDVRNWRRGNQMEGFLPEERDWMGLQLGPRTLVDVVRQLNPDTEGPYSWGPGWAIRSPTTSVGASTITWPPRDWRDEQAPLGWIVSRPGISGSATTLPLWSITTDGSSRATA